MVGHLDAIAVPTGERGQKKVMEIIFLNDDIVKENSGVYDFKGNKKKKPADFSLSSGSLLQLVSGYFVPEKLNSCFEIGNCYTLDLY